MRRLTALTYTALVLLLVMAPSLAAPPAGPSGTIALASGPVAAAASADGSATTTYGSSAAFDVTVDGKTAKQSRTYVTVLCWVDGQIEYQWSADPDFAFPLVDQAGQGLDWPEGAPAYCEAHLIYRVEKGKNVEMTTLDVTSFAVAGS